jgi:glycosyltransferase involved in cell wall biosynthesis
MARYGRLAARAMAARGWIVRPTRLGLRPALLRRLPKRGGMWMQNLGVLLAALVRPRRLTGSVCHVVDGSHAYVLLLSRARRRVATVHDVIPHLQRTGRLGPRRASWATAMRNRLQAAGLRRAHVVLADSERTAQDVASWLPGLEPRVVPCPLDPLFLQQPTRAPAHPPFVLHVGNDGFYKNRAGVVRIFARVARAHDDVRLILVGPPPSETLSRLVEEAHLRDRVTWRTEVDDAGLVGLYRSAAVLLFPSLYEGFGWPPLEAMSQGCPVVCSNAGSLPEIVGDAALTARPEDEEGLARHVSRVLTEPSTADRLAAEGRARATSFTLERFGAALRDAYDAERD